MAGLERVKNPGQAWNTELESTSGGSIPASDETSVLVTLPTAGTTQPTRDEIDLTDTLIQGWTAEVAQSRIEP